jgi:hypothetical protein
MTQKILAILAALFLSLTANAQTSAPPLLLQQSGGTPWVTGKLNCTGALTCTHSGFVSTLSVGSSSVTINTTSPLSGGGTGTTFTLSCPTCVTTSSLGNFVFSGNGVDLSGAAQMTIGAATATSILALNAVKLTTATPSWGVPGIAATGASGIAIETTPAGGNNQYLAMSNATGANSYMFFHIGGLDSDGGLELQGNTSDTASSRFHPNTDNFVQDGTTAKRWSGTFSYWYDLKAGSQLTVSSNTVTPTSGLHHVNGSGGPTIKTIATTNVPTSGNVRLTLIADTATINYDTTGNIGGTLLSGTIPQNTAQDFIWDGTKWYPVD